MCEPQDDGLYEADERGPMTGDDYTAALDRLAEQRARGTRDESKPWWKA